MPRLFFLLLVWVCSGLLGHAAAQDLLGSAVVKTERARVELLVHAPEGVAPGKPLWLGLQIEHAPDWHTYWKNPGDSGLPTELQWTLPAGVRAGDIAWPTPQKFPLGDLANYGYDGTVLLPVPLTVAADFKGRILDVRLQAQWLICHKECIPEQGTFRLSVPTQISSAAHTARFEAAWAAAPRTWAAGASQWRVEGAAAHITLDELPKAWQGQTLTLFPETPELIVPAAPGTQAWNGRLWTVTLPLVPHRTASPDHVAVVVRPESNSESGTAQGVRLDIPVVGTWPAAAKATTEVPAALRQALEQNAQQGAAPTVSTLSIGAALLGALLGGLILNLMPCVFPVLAIKVLAFARHKEQVHLHRLAGLAYTAGCVLSFVALGGVLLGLRAAGEQLGWGFQLQQPGVVAVLATLFTLIGLNLAGLFEIGHLLPSRLASLQLRHPVADAFLTGVLATAVASPCTAPFMGASIGLAIGLPVPLALGVFAMLGLGMALPYLLASVWPAVARALPRPGAWMVVFKQAMAFPMFATVVWLLWVLGQQTGMDGAAALLMLLVALTMWVWSTSLPRPTRQRWGVPTLALLLVLGYFLLPYVTAHPERGTPTGQRNANATWLPWSAELQANTLASGRPVFVDFTAAWCVTCQYNKRQALSDERVLQLAAERKVQLMRADWTNRDPQVTQALAQLGRNGVPTYVLWAPGRQPMVLTEILSSNEVIAALNTL